jgi:hypothetical protein
MRRRLVGALAAAAVFGLATGLAEARKAHERAS